MAKTQACQEWLLVGQARLDEPYDFVTHELNSHERMMFARQICCVCGKFVKQVWQLHWPIEFDFPSVLMKKFGCPLVIRETSMTLGVEAVFGLMARIWIDSTEDGDVAVATTLSSFPSRLLIRLLSFVTTAMRQ